MNSFIHFEDLAFNLDSLQFVFEGIRVFPWNTPQDLLMKGQILFPNNIMEIYALESEVAKDKLGNPLFWNMYCQEIKVLLETPIFSLENEENRKELQVEDEKESFVLSLKGPNGIILKIPFEENLPLNQLEKQYKELMKLQPAALICFYFDGEKLEMNKTPADCELEHEDCIEVRMI